MMARTGGARLVRMLVLSGLVVMAAVLGVFGPALFSDLSAVPARSVAIVPGSGVADGRPGPPLRVRLETALALYQSGRVKTILVSGNDTEASPEVSVMYAWLLRRGVPVGDIWTDEGG